MRRGSRGPARCALISALAVSLLVGTGCNTTLKQWTGFKNWSQNGFKVGPDYGRPAAPVADQWVESADPRLIGEPVRDCHWWTVFNDPFLDYVVQTAYDQNLPLKVAGLRVLEARASAGFTRGNLWPQAQQGVGSYNRNQASRNTANNPLGFGVPGPKRNFDLWDLGFQASWELDVWGRFRRAIESADATLDASVEDYDAVLVTLVSDVAATYINIRTIEQQLDYLRQNVEIQKGALELAQVRFRNGATTELDVTQAETNLANTKAQVPAFESLLRQAENGLCILLGLPPQDIDQMLGGVRPIPVTPREVAVGIPCDLLRRRPDVRRQERLVAASSANIGVAVADLFPSFSLVGNIGVQSEELSDLLRGGSVSGALSGPSITWNILNYGRILNNIEIQDARFKQQVVNYQQTVLAAHEEVENAMVAFLRTQEQFEEESVAVKAAERSVELALIQYRDGAVDFNRVFTLQAILATQQNQLAATQGDIATNLIDIYRGLGGGWEIRLCPPQQQVVMQAPVQLPVEAPMQAPGDAPPAPGAPPMPPADAAPAPMPKATWNVPAYPRTAAADWPVRVVNE